MENPFIQIQASLARPIPYDLCTMQPRWVKRAYHGQWCKFLIGTSWGALRSILDEAAPGWQLRMVQEPTQKGSRIYCIQEVAVPAFYDGQVVWASRAGVGIVDVNQDGELADGYGNPISNSATAAFKKACKMWGMAEQFEAPEIWMRIMSWDGSRNNKRPIYPDYDPGKAGSPWATNNPEGVPRYVREAMAQVGRPLNHVQKAQESSSPTDASEGRSGADRGRGRQGASKKEGSGAGDDQRALWGQCGLHSKLIKTLQEQHEAESLTKILQAVVELMHDNRPRDRENFISWAVDHDMGIDKPSSLQATLREWNERQRP